MAMLVMVGCQKQRVQVVDCDGEAEPIRIERTDTSTGIVAQGGAEYEAAIRKVTSIATTLYREGVSDQASVAQYVDSAFALEEKTQFASGRATRGGEAVTEAAKAVVEQMEQVDPFEYETEADYVDALVRIVDGSHAMLTELEMNTLRVAAQISADMIQERYGALEDASSGVRTRGERWQMFKEWAERQWNDWGRCAARIVGEACGGALSGAVAGSVVPGLGTTAGAVVGGIGGGLVGASSEACNPVE